LVNWSSVVAQAVTRALSAFERLFQLAAAWVVRKASAATTVVPTAEASCASSPSAEPCERAAGELHISPRTADRRLPGARAKLGVATTIEAIAAIGR
jgi:hypothetical protein